MSSTLYYKPVVSNEKSLPDELKHAIKRLDQFEQTIDRVFDESDIPILRGMEASGVKGAKKLISLIEKYGQVELTEEY